MARYLRVPIKELITDVAVDAHRDRSPCGPQNRAPSSSQVAGRTNHPTMFFGTSGVGTGFRYATPRPNTPLCPETLRIALTIPLTWTCSPDPQFYQQDSLSRKRGM